MTENPFDFEKALKRESYCKNCPNLEKRQDNEEFIERSNIRETYDNRKVFCNYPRPSFGNPNADIMLIADKPAKRGSLYEMHTEKEMLDKLKTTRAMYKEQILQHWWQEGFNAIYRWVFEKYPWMPGEAYRKILKNLYFTDRVKCPTEEDVAQEKCKKYLEKEVKEVNPKLFITIGKKALRTLSRFKGFDSFNLISDEGPTKPPHNTREGESYTVLGLVHSGCPQAPNSRNYERYVLRCLEKMDFEL